VAYGDLKAEMALLGRGQHALQAGEPAAALRAFDRHASLYPNGILAEERMLKRMVALCELGRRSEARTEAERFVRANPGSPLSAHASTICSDERPGGRSVAGSRRDR
jgi:outer membrane protein assembly factor BamD (BamD/ComL family)